jgi:hypothetical protein
MPRALRDAVMTWDEGALAAVQRANCGPIRDAADRQISLIF